MKFEDIKANFDKIEFHRPTKNISGTGIQMKGTRDGKVIIQMAKQATANTMESKATYSWTDPSKNTSFILESDELRKVIRLIRMALRGKVNLFIQDKHNRIFEGDGRNQPFSNVKLFHNSNSGGKNILFLVKEFREEVQLELSVYFKVNGKSNSLMFSFTKEEMEKLEMLFYLHQVRELPVPEGIFSCILDENRNVLRYDFMPNLNKGDFITLSIQGNRKSYEIKRKTYVTNKNILVYSV